MREGCVKIKVSLEDCGTNDVLCDMAADNWSGLSVFRSTVFADLDRRREIGHILS